MSEQGKPTTEARAFFTDLKAEPVYTGRDLGLRAREVWCMDSQDDNPDVEVVFYVPHDTYAVSESFWRGLLDDSLDKCADEQAAHRKMRVDGPTQFSNSFSAYIARHFIARKTYGTRKTTMKFEFMDDTVDELCRSMGDDPNRWVIDIYTLNDTKTHLKYWIGAYASNDRAITEIENGRSNHRVFSDKQGKRLWDAYEKLRETKANAAQRRVLDAMGKVEGKVTKANAPAEMSFGLGVLIGVVVGMLVVGVFLALP